MEYRLRKTLAALQAFALIAALAPARVMGGARGPVRPVKVVPMGPAGSAAASAGAAHFQTQISLINSFRLNAQLPSLTLSDIEFLRHQPAVGVDAVQLEAAKAFLERVNPRFATEAKPDAVLLETAEETEFRKTVAVARKVLVRHELSILNDSRGVDSGKIDALYSGNLPHQKRLLAMVDSLAVHGAQGNVLREMIRDGDKRGAIETLGRLRKHNPALRKRAAKPIIKELTRELNNSPISPRVLTYRLRLDAATALLKKGAYTEAFMAATALGHLISGAPLRVQTRRGLGVEGIGIEETARKKGAPRLYDSRKHRADPRKLAEKISGLLAHDSSAYVGDAIEPGNIRIQKCGDCAVQRTYNHARMERVSEQIPYPSFLRMIEHYTGKDFREDGMSGENGELFRQFGLQVESHRMPKVEKDLAKLLRDHGGMNMSIRFAPTSSLKDYQGDHAALLQGAYREDGHWNFIVIDSNHNVPRVYSYAELKLLRAQNLHSVSEMPLSDKNYPDIGRSFANATERTRRLIHAFYQTYGLRRPARVSVWQDLFLWAINPILMSFGYEPWEPSRPMELDSNAVLPSQLPRRLNRRLTAYRREGKKLPFYAFVKDERRGFSYYNKRALESILTEAGF